MTDPEQRTYETGFELREAQATGGAGGAGPWRYLEGLAVPYDTWAQVGSFIPFLEQHAVGSFERSTKGGSGKSLPLLLFHDNRNWPIGHAEKWTHDGAGMHGVWRLNGTDDAQKAAQMAHDGDLAGMSVGFQPIRSEWKMLDGDEWDPDGGADHLDKVTRLESRLLETSLTPTPAFVDASVTLVRSAYHRAAPAPPQTEVVRYRAELERLRSR